MCVCVCVCVCNVGLPVWSAQALVRVRAVYISLYDIPSMPVPVHVRAYVCVCVRGFCANNERSRGRIRRLATKTSRLGCPRAGAKAGVFSCYSDPTGRGGGEKQGERKRESERERLHLRLCPCLSLY